MKPEKLKISAENLLGKMPLLALSGDDSAIDLILYEVLKLLTNATGADIGQINLLPKGGRVEKVCIIKDGKPWLRKGMDMHLFDPFRGFTGLVIKAGRSILVKDIWDKDSTKMPNPFLELVPDMNYRYISEIKKPVASIIIFPIKRGNEIFCTVELSRYRDRKPFGEEEREHLDGFANRYGSLIMDYIIDVRNRLAVHAAHQKLLAIARLIASNKVVDYRDAVEAYRELSAADIGMAFFNVGGLRCSGLRLIPWYGEETRELFLPEFIPSPDSILRDDIGLAFPLEGEENDRRIVRFHKRIQTFPGLSEKERKFTLKCLENIRSYVIYPLHMLGQDLGAVLLGSHRPKFWDYLHMNPFLSLYNSLLKSFLLNERLAHLVSDISLKIHNPGFYCLAGLKGNLIQKYPRAFSDPKISQPLGTLENLLNELHDQRKMLKCRKKSIKFVTWILGFVRLKKSQHPVLEINLDIDDSFSPDCVISGIEENLETVFENLFVNSIRAINSRRQTDPSIVGRIDISVRKIKGKIRVKFQDNGISYKTVSGRGMPQLRSIMQDLGGSIRKYDKPYRIYLAFPLGEGLDKGDSR
ncbi:MAG: GAF domain-containing sensor histidine kinase [Deltaproteobacteria bacterium]|nr:GAF domain-containing sensor histidine kinase [Deltaproteobacteria bacterium]